MPNHITNQVKVKDLGGTQLSEVHAKLLNEKRHIDFEVIHHKPDCLTDFEPDSQVVNIAYEMLKIPCSGVSIIAMLESQNRMRDFAAYDGLPDERKAMVQRCLDNHKQCGYVYWYDFCTAEWGTKWNAYNQPEEGFPADAIEFTFETAWQHPEDLMKKASMSLPNVTFEINFADEDTGSNCGTYTIKNGEILSSDIAPSWSKQTPEQKAKFTKFAFNLCHPDVDPRSYGYGSDWVYSDEIYEAYEAEIESSKAA